MSVHLCYNYYHPKNATRQFEVRACFEANLRNPSIDCIHVVLDSAVEIAQFLRTYETYRGKIKLLEFRGRPTFLFWMRHLASLKEGYGIICNSDIYVPEDTCMKLKNSKMGQSQCLALSRYNCRGVQPADLRRAVLFNRRDSQDTWIFPLPLFKASSFGPSVSFPLGRWGCDNRFAYELHKMGFQVKNRAKSHRTYHYHTVRPQARGPGSQTVPGPYKLLSIIT